MGAISFQVITKDDSYFLYILIAVYNISNIPYVVIKRFTGLRTFVLYCFGDSDKIINTYYKGCLVLHERRETK